MKRSGGHLSNRAQTVAEREVVQPAGGQRGIVWHMEDVLDIYQRPLDPARSLVCLDETSRQLLSDARPPRPGAPDGRPAMTRRRCAAGWVAAAPLQCWR